MLPHIYAKSIKTVSKKGVKSKPVQTDLSFDGARSFHIGFALRVARSSNSRILIREKAILKQLLGLRGFRCKGSSVQNQLNNLRILVENR